MIVSLSAGSLHIVKIKGYIKVMKWAIVNKKESNVTIKNKNTIAKFCIEFLINTKKRGI